MASSLSWSINRAHCPYLGCEFKTAQRSNLVAHMNSQQFVALMPLASFLFIPFPSTNEYRYPCPDCGKGFTDPAARIKHRKAAHGYQPYHTPRYYARRALKEAEKRAKGSLKKTSDQKAANPFPPSTQSASSSSSSSSSSSADSLSNLLANATYHDDFWKLLVEVPRGDAPEPIFSQDAQISAPIAVAPARESPKTLHSDSDLYLPNVETGDEVPLCGHQLDTLVQPQSQAAYDQPWAAYGHAIPGAESEYLPFPATFPTLSEQSTYPDTIFQSLPTFSFTNDASTLPNSFDSPTSSMSSSLSHISGPQFFSSDYIPAPPLLEPVPVLGWSPSLFSDISTPIQTEFSTGEPNRSFDTWYQSNVATTSNDTSQPF